MEDMRSVLRKSLGRSLGALPELDRLAAAWPVACGKALAARGRITAFAAGTVTVQVDDPAWLAQMLVMRGALQHDLARIAEVQVTAIHFESTAAKFRPPRRGSRGSKGSTA